MNCRSSRKDTIFETFNLVLYSRWKSRSLDTRTQEEAKPVLNLLKCRYVQQNQVQEWCAFFRRSFFLYNSIKTLKNHESIAYCLSSFPNSHPRNVYEVFIYFFFRNSKAEKTISNSVGSLKCSLQLYILMFKRKIYISFVRMISGFISLFTAEMAYTTSTDLEIKMPSPILNDYARHVPDQLPSRCFDKQLIG